MTPSASHWRAGLGTALAAAATVAVLAAGLLASNLAKIEDSGRSGPPRGERPLSPRRDDPPTPAVVRLPTKIDVGLLCSGVDEADVTALMGAPIAERGRIQTGHRGAVPVYSCTYRTVDRAGLSLAWHRPMGSLIARMHALDKPSRTAGCGLTGAVGIRGEAAVVLICEGSGSRDAGYGDAPREIRMTAGVGEGGFVCELRASPDHGLAASAAEFVTYCLDTIASLAG